MQIAKIVSGGQTGADLAALDAALERGVPCGGWVPRGRTHEAGRIPAHYPELKETASPEPRERTERNVKDADATVIFSHGALHGGSLHTYRTALAHNKPVRHIDFDRVAPDAAVAVLRRWLSGLGEAGVLNVAGPRASEDPLIYEKTKRVLDALLRPEEEGPPA